MFSKTSSLKRHLLACVVAGGISFTTVGSVSAADCGCEVSCTSCPPVSHSGCTCKCSKGPGHFHKAWNALAGGVEKLLSVGSCSSDCDSAGCDDACDAAMIEELMLPVPSPMHHHNHHQQTLPMESVPRHQHATPYTGPTEDVRITPMGPSQWQDAGQPRVSPGSGQHLGLESPLPSPVERVPPPVRMKTNGEESNPIPEVQPRTEGGSLFDTLSDPFSDDEARVNTYRPVRPSSYQQPIARSSSTDRPLSRSNQTSSRRVKSVR